MRGSRLAKPAAILTLLVGLSGGPALVSAKERDLDEAMRLVSAGLRDPALFDKARTVFASVLRDDSGRSGTDRELARYGLAELRRNEALAASINPKYPYPEVLRGFEEAVAALEDFAKRYAKHHHATGARLRAGTTWFGFVTWAHALLSDGKALLARGANASAVAADASRVAEHAIDWFDALRKVAAVERADDLRDLAAFYVAVGHYYRALVEKPATKVRAAALQAAARALDGFITEHDGGLPGAHAQNYRGLVAWEQAKAAASEDSAVRHYREAVVLFEATLSHSFGDPAWRRLTAHGAVHLAQACLEAGRLGAENFHRVGSNYLRNAIARFPWLWREPDGLQAVITWANIEDRRGRRTEAVELAARVAEQAREIALPFLERSAQALVLQIARELPLDVVGSEELRALARSARAAIEMGEPRLAIRLCQAAITSAPQTPAAFVEVCWPAWRQIGEAYARMGQPLKQALALSAIHEAWIGGLIPRGPGGAAGPHLGAAGADRRASQAALLAAAKRAGSSLLRARAHEMGLAFSREYPGHPAREPKPWVQPISVEAEAPAPSASWAPALELNTKDATRPSDPPSRKLSTGLNDALRWLAAHQSPNGGWEAAGFMHWCDGKPIPNPAKRTDGAGHARYDVGVTGLALCAFLGAGYTHRGAHPFSRAVARGLGYLRRVQDPDGCFGTRATQRYIFNHATAALAAVEAYGRTHSAILRGPAQRGLDFIALCRNPYFGWRYGIKPGDNDTAVSGWMMMPLQSAMLANRSAIKRGENAPLMIDDSAWDGLKAWLEKVTDPDNGRVGYVLRGAGPAQFKEVGGLTAAPLRLPAVPGARREVRAESEAPTAIGMLARFFMGEEPTSRPISLGADLCARVQPNWNTSDASFDLVYWYFGTLAMHRIGGKRWESWLVSLRKAVLQTQRQDTTYCQAKGSWDPRGKWGRWGGRVYATAMLAMILEAYDGHETLFGYK